MSREVQQITKNLNKFLIDKFQEKKITKIFFISHPN